MNLPAVPRGRGDAVVRAIHRALPPIIAGVACALLLSLLAVPVAVASWRYEAEDINPSFCHTAGGIIKVVSCSIASGGRALEGLTMLGDWAEIRVTFDRETCFIDSVRCASSVLSSWQFLVEFRPEDRPDSVVARSEHASVAGRGVG
jgi:hypothetical protein